MHAPYNSRQLRVDDLLEPCLGQRAVHKHSTHKAAWSALHVSISGTPMESHRDSEIGARFGALLQILLDLRHRFARDPASLERFLIQLRLLPRRGQAGLVESRLLYE